MNIITIDPSLSCTAVCINGRFYVYASTPTAKTKTGKYKKWFERMEQYVEYRTFDPVPKNLSYSDTEVAKLILYDKITARIISDIALNMDNDDPDTLVCIEGYSYSSVSNSLIDLVTFSTLLRMKLFIDITEHLMVVSPSTLKVRTCEFTYGERFNDKGKQLSCVNCSGTSGGRFKKPEMLNALVENETLDGDWYVNVLRNVFPELVDNKVVTTIPKPIEDINDAKLMYEIILGIASNTDCDIVNVESKFLK